MHQFLYNRPRLPRLDSKTLLIGAGLCTERTLSTPVDIVCVIEIGDSLIHSKDPFPNARVLENFKLDSVIGQLKGISHLKLFPLPLLYVHISRKSQVEFARLIKPPPVVVEMVTGHGCTGYHLSLVDIFKLNHTKLFFNLKKLGHLCVLIFTSWSLLITGWSYKVTFNP